MNYFNKNRVTFWILIFLIVVNLAAAGTFIVYFSGQKSDTCYPEACKSGCPLQEKLSLTPEQTKKVEAINAAYKEKSEPVTIAIRQKRARILEELSKDQSDSLVINKLGEELSLEQKKMQEANNSQFLELKKVCTPEQTQKLSAIYSELYGCKGMGMGKGKGRCDSAGMGQRHR